MTLLLTLISTESYIDPPRDWIAWIGWLTFFIGVVYLNIRWRRYNKTVNRRWFLYGGLLVLGALASLFIGFRLPPGQALPPPGVPLDPKGPAVMLFAALPWILAAGLLGPLNATGIALVTGLFLALYETHNPFTPLEIALIAVVFAALANQRYRTRAYRLFSQPLPAALLLAALYPFVALASLPFSASGALASRLDYATTHLGSTSLAFAIELLVGGLFGQVIALLLPRLWGGSGNLVPSPAEQSLQARFLYGMAPLAVILALTLMVGDWFVAGRAAREMLRGRMANAAELAAETLPYYLQTGQNLVRELAADPDLATAEGRDLSTHLQRGLRQVPFFRQLYLLDREGRLIAGYPTESYLDSQAPLEEQMAVQLALNGIPVQSYAIPPEQDETSAQVTFVAPVQDASGKVERVLIGRSDLVSNPYTQPLVASLGNLAGIEGQGLLVDDNGRIIYHVDPALIMTPYSLEVGSEPLFFEDPGPDGTRQLVYARRTTGEPWLIVFTIPAHRADQLALEIATPLLAILVILSIIGAVVLRLGLRVITASLQTLSLEAGRISQGQLDHPLQTIGEDEVGNLRRSFEHMRLSLKARLDELNRLLLVSQGVASSLEFSEAVQPVLESVLATGANSVRVVLVPTIVPELDGNPPTPLAYGLGPLQAIYAGLDEQILGLARQQDRIVLTNPTRPRLIHFPQSGPHPEALVVISLRHENLFFGALWAAYGEPHTFAEDEIRFLTTLAGQAALAAANSRLFLTAEIGRQRLAAILASTPDPVLVTDQQDHLLLANPAAWQVLSLGMDTDEGQPIDEVISQPELVGLLRAEEAGHQSAEVCLPDGRIYLATASSVLAEGQPVGRVCVMRDVTHFKELDALKSEFVHTVSHDLRSPLTLMRGYATMLEMVGDLNEQQVGYVRKIVTGVESMSRLVNNLLDLGRIEAGVGLQLEMIPAGDIAERVVSALQLQASQKRIQLDLVMPERNALLIEADQGLLQQALQNLVENAIKYTRPEGRVRVQLITRQDRLVFEVADTGIGVSPMDQARLFEKFYRGAQQGSKEQKGTGLGLAIVRSIAERHGGRVWVESQLGKGSTFYLSIPMRQPERLSVSIERHDNLS